MAKSKYKNSKKGSWGWKKNSNTLVRRSRGNMKAALRQTDQSSTVLNINSVISCKQNAGADGVEVKSGATGIINLFDLLRRSEFFNNYAPMYDQFRIDSAVIKLGIAYGMDGGFITIYTAWDRNGLDTNQFVLNATNHTAGSNIGTNIATYSSAVSKNYVAGGNWTCSRSISASSLQEKNQFIGTDSLKQWYNAYNNTTNLYDINEIDANNLTSTNPCFPWKNDVYPFKPTFLVGVVGLDKVTEMGPFKFTVEADIAVTFRGLRKSEIV